MFQFLVIGFLAFAIFDAWITNRRVIQAGLEVEYNPLIRWLAKQVGVEAGIYLGVLVPTLILISLADTFPRCFIFLAGARTTLFSFQMRTLKGSGGRTE